MSLENPRPTVGREFAQATMDDISGLAVMVGVGIFLKKTQKCGVELYESTEENDPNEYKLRILWHIGPAQAKQLELAVLPEGTVNIRSSTQSKEMKKVVIESEDLVFNTTRLKFILLRASFRATFMEPPIIAINNGLIDKIKGRKPFVFWQQLPLTINSS